MGGQTSLSDLRRFLVDERCPPEPRPGPERLLRGLLHSLVDRCDDDHFWSCLRNLSGGLDDDRLDTSALPSPVEQLVDDLRRHLTSPRGRRTLEQWYGPDAPECLFALLLFGFALCLENEERAPDVPQ